MQKNRINKNFIIVSMLISGISNFLTAQRMYTRVAMWIVLTVFLCGERAISQELGEIELAETDLAGIELAGIELAGIELAGIEFEEFEIANKALTSIIDVFADVYGITILYDATVNGNASHKFVNIDFETAIELFLEENNLYARKDEKGVYHVSKIYIIKKTDDFDLDTNADLFDIKAKDVDVEALLSAISEYTQRNIVYDRLPKTDMSIFSVSQSLKTILETIEAKLGNDFYLTTRKDFFYFKDRTNSNFNTTGIEVARDGDKYRVNVSNTSARVLIQTLFYEAEKEYISMLEKNKNIEDIYFRGKQFDALLELVLASVGAEYSIRDDGVYILYETQGNNLMRENKEVAQFNIKYLPVDVLVESIPRDYLALGQPSIDKSTNSFVFIGNKQEIARITQLVQVLDKQDATTSFRLDLVNISIAHAEKIIHEQFPEARLKAILATNSLLIDTDSESYKSIVKYIDLVESSTFTKLIALRYVQSSDVLENLPARISKDELQVTSDPTMVLFNGNIARYQKVKEEIELLDIPRSQIRYQILVIQYNQTSDFSFGLGLGNDYISPDSATSVLGSFSNIFSLSFDILSTFGMVFSAELSASLQSGKSKIFIDTILRSLSGKKVEFASDSTYRYQEAEIGTSNNTTTNRGVTREIRSGFNISISGWVSGDNYVTMDIETELSSLGVDTTSTNPPPSYQKKLITNVKTLAGEPVVIGGLYQDEKEIGQGSGLLLGMKNAKKRIEYRVYIIPILETVSGTANIHHSAEKIYKRYISNE